MSARPRVLIVDDERGVRESLRAILGADCDVVTAASGDEALAHVREHPFDVVTLDLRMPGQDGISVLEAIRRIDTEVEALIITGYGSFDTAVKGLRHRVFDYLAKPFDAAQVRHTVQAAIARRTAVQRLRKAPEHILSTLSHEFRTPLNVILGYSAMMQDEADGPLTQEQQRALDRIQSNSSALLSYVEALFYMVELDRGLVPLVLGPVRMVDVLERVRLEAAQAAAEKGLALAIDVPVGLGLVTDGDKCERLVRVFVDNAVRYTASGGVTVVASAAGDDVVIEVRDTGAGMAPALVAEARTVVDGRSADTPPEQLGFGLRLAGRLVRALGGSLAIAGGAAGTTCTITLPSLADGAADMPALASNG